MKWLPNYGMISLAFKTNSKRIKLLYIEGENLLGNSLINCLNTRWKNRKTYSMIMKYCLGKIIKWKRAKIGIVISKKLTIKKLTEIISNRLVDYLRNFTLNTPHKRRSKINQNIISNQAKVMQCIENDTQKRESDIKVLQQHIGVYHITHVFHRRFLNIFANLLLPRTFVSESLSNLSAKIEQLSAENKDLIDSTCKKDLQINLDQLEEKKAGLPTSQTTNITSTGSGGPHFPSIQEIADPIIEVGECLETAIIETKVPENYFDEGMTYLIKVEKKVSVKVNTNRMLIYHKNWIIWHNVMQNWSLCTRMKSRCCVRRLILSAKKFCY